MLNHDENGFLKGEPIKKDEPQSGDPDHPSRALDSDAMLAIWDGMASDIAAIRTNVERAPKAVTPTGRADNPIFAVVVPRGAVQPSERQGRIATARAISVVTRPSLAVAQPVARSAHSGATSAVAATSDRVARPAARRDASGRFVASGGEGRPDKAESKAREQSMLDGVARRVVATVSGATRDNGQVDPTLQAVSEVAQPVARGYSALSGALPGGPKRQERWYRRIFGELRAFRKEETAFSKATSRTLKDIEKKPDAQGGGGGSLSVIPALFAGVAPLFMGLLKKVPLVGGLLTGGMNLFDIFSSETDDSLTREEKDKKTGKGVGGLAGTLGGMWAGAKLGAAVGALGGPIGIAIGGVVGGAAGMFFGDKAGKVVGETVGGWVADLRSADIAGMISQKWEAATTWISNGWDTGMASFNAKWNEVSDGFSAKWGELTKGLQGKWDTLMGDLKGLWGSVTKSAGEAFDWVKDKGDQANNYIKEVAGVDVKETAKAAVASTKEVAASAIASVKSAGNAANDYVKEKTGIDVKETAGKAVTTAKEGAAWVGDKASDAVSWVGDKITGRSGANKDALIAEMGRSGITDPKEQAMFMAQMDHESGGFKSYEENLNYSAAGLRKTFGKYFKTDAEAQAAARNPEMIANKVYGGRMGNIDPGDGYKFRGRGAIQLTGRDNYARAGEALGLDLVNNPDLAKDPENAAKIAAWYWKSRNVGEAARAGNVEAATRKINGGLNGVDDRRTKYEKYVAQANAGAFGGGEAAPAGHDVATVSPPVNATAAVQSPVASPVLMAAAPVQTASAPAVNPPSIPAPPAIAEAPKVPVPLGSGDSGKPTQVNASPPDAGQDVRDRRIAHIVTGGYAS